MTDDRCIPIEEIIGNPQVRQLAGGITRATLIAWRRTGRAGHPHPFPAPIKELPGVGELWDARAVRAWLENDR